MISQFDLLNQRRACPNCGDVIIPSRQYKQYCDLFYFDDKIITSDFSIFHKNANHNKDYTFYCKSVIKNNSYDSVIKNNSYDYAIFIEKDTIVENICFGWAENYPIFIYNNENAYLNTDKGEIKINFDVSKLYDKEYCEYQLSKYIMLS